MSEYTVIKTTSSELQTALNNLGDLYLHKVQWLGGRDWVIIAVQPQVLLEASVQLGSVGWVGEQAERHARAYSALDSPDVSYGTLPGGVPGEVLLVDPEVEWGDIRYGRYDTSKLSREFTGWVEDRARTWIIFFGPHGAPALYFPRRDSGGGVIGQPIDLRA